MNGIHSSRREDTTEDVAYSLQNYQPKREPPTLVLAVAGRKKTKERVVHQNTVTKANSCHTIYERELLRLWVTLLYIPGMREPKLLAFHWAQERVVPRLLLDSTPHYCSCTRTINLCIPYPVGR
jgi:hypothetical protein